MALNRKKRKVDPQEVIPRISKDTLNFTESLNNPTWVNERKWASEIMEFHTLIGFHSLTLININKSS